MKPHICFVALNAFPLLANDRSIPVIGGAELQQVVVSKLLRDNEFQVSFICLDHGQHDSLLVDRMTVHKTYRDNEGIPGVRFVFPRLLRIWQALARADADVYYQRTAGMMTGVVAAFCKRHAKKSIFASAGDPDLEKETPRIRFARDRKIFEYGVRNVDRIVVQNETQLVLCNRNYGRQAILIPNCLPSPGNTKRGSARYVLWVSTIRSVKQPHLIVDIAKSLPEYKFVMIGGKDPYEPGLYDDIKKKTSAIKNIDFLGHLPFDETDTFFDSAALLVNTSESEGFPNAFLQAWSRKVPTVSFVDCGAAINGSPVGMLAGSLADIIETIKKLMDDDDLRCQYGDFCYEYYTANNAPNAVLPKYEDLLTDIL